jgi:hypothetical protein
MPRSIPLNALQLASGGDRANGNGTKLQGERAPASAKGLDGERYV